MVAYLWGQFLERIRIILFKYSFKDDLKKTFYKVGSLVIWVFLGSYLGK